MTNHLETVKTPEPNIEHIVDNILKKAQYVCWSEKTRIGISCEQYDVLDSVRFQSEQLIGQLSNLSEQELYKGLLKSKRLNDHIDLICKNLAKTFVSQASKEMVRIERNNKAQEEARIIAEQAADSSEEGKRKLMAQKAALNKLLTKQQKAALKKVLDAAGDPTGLFGDVKKDN